MSGRLSSSVEAECGAAGDIEGEPVMGRMEGREGDDYSDQWGEYYLDLRYDMW